jgi:hypothetical protein
MALASQKGGAKAPLPSFARTLLKSLSKKIGFKRVGLKSI